MCSKMLQSLLDAMHVAPAVREMPGHVMLTMNSQKEAFFIWNFPESANFLLTAPKVRGQCLFCHVCRVWAKAKNVPCPIAW